MSSGQDAIQLIDEQKQFHQDALSYFQKCIGKRDVGLDYHVISVFGSQSSGKSTLLNTLFKTTFDTMDAQFKRQQTTKGIWLAHTRNVNTVSEPEEPTSDLFVLDVEGSDGAERGEDQDFERKAALFAIAVSEVLIVNMWEQQIGLYQGNNMALLKTVFEVNLSLFGKNKNSHKVLLLFVIRDHVGVTPLSSLSESLINELEKIWSELSKPTECSDASLSDFFDLEFVGLAHKLLQPKEFEEGVKKLGDSFVLNNHDPYYFQPQYHHNLPLDGWTMYSENCWEQIENNRDLDLPTQQILVSRFKTEEIANEAFNNFEARYNEEVDPIIHEKEKLKQVLKTLEEDCLKEYDEQASRYAETVYLEKRGELVEKMTSRFTQSVHLFLNNLSKSLWQRLHTEIGGKRNMDKSFAEVMQAVCASVKSDFRGAAEEFKQLGFLSSSEETIAEFDDALAKETKTLRDQEVAAIVTRAKKSITLKIKEETIRLLSNPEKDVWEHIMRMFEQTIKDAMQKYEKGDEIYDLQVGLSDEENDLIYQKIRCNAWHLLNVTVHDYLKEDTVVGILRDRFEVKFRYDENDSPRLWKNEEEIDEAFKIAKEHALEILGVLSLAATSDNIEIVAQFEDKGDGEDEYYEDELGIYHSRKFAHILTELQKEKVQQQFRRQINVSVLDSKRSILRTTTSIPIWIYIIIAVLGWNEFMMVIRNPLFVTLALVLAITFYFVNKFGLWGPVLNVAQSAVGETRSTIKEKLRSFVLDEQDRKPIPVAESFEMQDLSTEKEE